VISIKHTLEQSRIWNACCTHAAVVYLFAKCFLGNEPAYYGGDITSALLPSFTRGLCEILQFFFFFGKVQESFGKNIK